MIVFEIARTVEELEEATALIQDVYNKEGYISSKNSVSDIPIGAYLGTDDSITILSRLNKNKSLVGTISVVLDQSRGLPMDQIFRDELDVLRAQNSKIAEVCQFAIDTDKLRKQVKEKHQISKELDVSVGLFGRAVGFCFFHAVDCLCFVVNPKHSIFYKSLGCIQIGPERVYPSVNNAMAQAYMLDLKPLHSTTPISQKRSFLLKKIIEIARSTEVSFETQKKVC